MGEMNRKDGPNLPMLPWLVSDQWRFQPLQLHVDTDSKFIIHIIG
jgi:hypothetical protein